MVSIRRNIKNLSHKQKLRVVNAIAKMMEPQRGGSEYEKLAVLHTNYCAHGVESFPVWHRIYIAIFEASMQVLLLIDSFTLKIVKFVTLINLF
ncbi:metalloendopeptidase activity [Bonamia ostreae]|uniref:Metalloendopeptidase activity n=1 Tax=Bonamia ostreae TaxID=126728 RepID=A0ABV2ANZ3_9EUKA